MAHQHFGPHEYTSRDDRQSHARGDASLFSMMVQSVAIGSILYMANSFIRHYMRDALNPGRGRYR